MAYKQHRRSKVKPRAMGPPLSRQPHGDLKLWYRCLRKLPYSKREATNVVNERNRRLSHTERDYVAYRCEHCEHYHVGHAVKVKVHDEQLKGT